LIVIITATEKSGLSNHLREDLGEAIYFMHLKCNFMPKQFSSWIGFTPARGGA
jgi:hypothetical protein